MNKTTVAAARNRRYTRMELLLADLMNLPPDYQPDAEERRRARELGEALCRHYTPKREASALEAAEAAPAPEALEKKAKK